MAWPWLAVIAKNVPWVELARRAPDILAKSRELLEESRKLRTPGSGAATSEELTRRVEALEARDAEHARLLAEMVEQLQGLTAGIEVLRARNRLLTWLVAAAIAGLVATLVAARTAAV